MSLAHPAPSAPPAPDDAIAIIGLSCRFPAARDADAFWRNLCDGIDCSRRFDRATLRAAGVPDAVAGDPLYVPVAAPIDDPDQFDAALFGYARADAEALDPQQRLFLQAGWHALEHAGHAPRHAVPRTGVFAACRLSTYPGLDAFRAHGPSQVRGMQALLGNDKDYLATRVAYKLGLTGPALTIQTACSSSLVAVHVACESLRVGECDMALAGGVAVSFPQQQGYLYQPGMIFSPDGRCRPFDTRAQGTFAGHGVGVVVLRRLADAMADGDRVLAIVRGSAVNNDGHRKAGFTAPSVAGQQDVVRDAMAMAAIGPDDLDLIEAHGTGTPLGDPIEIEGLRAALAGRSPGAPRCLVGAVKGNIGHLDTAAGIAGLIKTVLAVHHGTIPPTLHCEQPIPALDADDSPLAAATAAMPWPRAVRTAGVSAFGLGGTNCHVIVQSAPDSDSNSAPASADAVDDAAAPVLLLSAASAAALRGLAGAYAQAWRSGAPASGLAATALHGRALDLDHRLALAMDAEALPALEVFASGGTDVAVHTGHGRGRQLWLFGGQGTQWPGMSVAMARHSAAFAQMLDRCCAACDAQLALPLRAVMDGEHPEALRDMAYVQPAIVAFELAMAAHWQSLGLRPDAVLGHSVGEYAAAIVAGHYEPEDLLPLVVTRGRLMQHHARDGAMLAAFAADADVLPLADACGVEVAAWNGPRHVVLSGHADDIDRVALVLRRAAVAHARLAVPGAAHSKRLDPMLDRFAQAAAGVHAGPGNGIVLWSTLLARPIDAATLNQPDYWRRHVREPVHYRQALAGALDDDVAICLELSPDAPLTGMGQAAMTADGDASRGAGPRNARHWIASARRNQPGTATLREALCRLYAAGAALPWQRCLPCDAPRVAAPLYPFDTARYWPEGAASAMSAGPATAAPSAAGDAGNAATHAATDAALAAGSRAAVSGAAALDLDRLSRLNQCAAALHGICVDTMVRQCVGDAIDAGVTMLEVLQRGGLLPRHRQLLARLLRGCVEDGVYQCDADGRYRTAAGARHGELPALLATLRGCCEGLDVIADTIARGGSQLCAMMRGDVDPVAVIFPEGAEDGVEVLYRDFSFGRYFNEIAAATLDGLARARPPGQPLRVLEVGAGTGGTTTLLLQALAGHTGVRYTFTDISAVFTRRAQARFAQHDFVDYREFDLQRDAAAQGFAAGQFDVIVAANVIHATQHVGQTLAMLHGLLAPGGHLLMREITQPMRLFDFVFGPLVAPLHDEAARGGELFLDTARWAAHCQTAGFAQTCWLPSDDMPNAAMSEHVLLARSGAVAAATAAMPAPDTVFARTWHAIVPAAPAPEGGADARGSTGWPADWRVLHIAPADVPASELPALAAPLLAALADPAQGPLAVVTHNAWAIDDAGGPVPPWPAHQAIWALLRVAAAEQPARMLAAIDLHGDTPSAQPDADDVAVAAAAIAAGERWIAVRGAAAYRPALAPATQFAAPPAPGWLQATGWHVVTGGFGGLGRVACAWLAAHGARRIAVLAPREPDDGATWRASMATDHRCHVRWVPCDMADAAQVARQIALLAADGGVAGAIHAAGKLDDTPLANLTAERLADVVDVKAGGAEALLAALADARARYVLLYSSAAATLGSPGQGAHALASGYLDGLALRARTGGMAVVSIAWGAWAGAGRAADPAMLARLEAAGMGSLSTAEGLWHLDQAVTRGAPLHLAMRLAGGVAQAVADDGGRPTAASAPADAPLRLGGVPADDQAAIEDWLRHRIAMQLRMDDPTRMDARQDLLQLGLDSLQFLELNSAVQRATGARLDAAQAYRDMTLRGLAGLLAQALAPGRADGAQPPAAHTAADTAPAQIVSDRAGRHDPFPLTPIQHAYWLGRTHLIAHGGVACHVLFEWDLATTDADAGGFDLTRFEDAWNALVAQHDMLRMVIGDDGMQRVLPDVPRYRIAVASLRGLPPDDVARRLLETRARLAAAVPPAHRWPLFEVCASRLDGGRLRLHMNLDLLQFDVQSLKVMMDDLAAAYAGAARPAPAITFRDYVMAEQAQRGTAEWRTAWRYWRGVVQHLPPAPPLPLAATAPAAAPHVTTRQMTLDATRWARLRTLWRTWGITPSAGILAVFAQVLARACRQPAFTLNLTFFNRQPLHPDVNRLIGDFTSVMLVDFDIEADTPLREVLHAVQATLWDRLAHARVNGVEVLRLYTREHGADDGAHRGPAMPVVFTSMLGMTLDGQPIERALTRLLGEPVHVFTQTPQVWIDHQVMEVNGELVCHWYCMDDVLAPGVAAELFGAFRDTLEAIADRPARMRAAPDLPAPRLDPHPAVAAPPHWPADVDAGTLEAWLRRHPAVRHAALRPAPDGQGMEAWIVTHEPACGVAASTAPTLLASAGLPQLDDTTLAAFDNAWQWLERRARDGIVATLRRHGLFARTGDCHSATEVAHALAATPRTSQLLCQWLARLHADGCLDRDGVHYRATALPAPGADPLPGAPAPWLGTLARYVEGCVAQHDALIQGRQSALALMFGHDDGLDVARAFYRDNPVAAALNASAGAVIAQLAQASHTGLRVLEAGAGTGATTEAVLTALQGLPRGPALYRFTDVSPWFLDAARDRFGHGAPMEYGLFDLNRPVDFDAHPADGYDVIVVAQALHDACDIPRSLARLRRLLRAGGHLVLIEATARDSYLQLASVGFMEALAGFDDARADDGQPMLALPTWRSVLDAAGFSTVLTWPPGDDWRQHLIVAQAGETGRLDAAALDRYLKARWPDAPPLCWRQCERLPQVAGAEATVTAPDPGGLAQPACDPQRRAAVGAVWQNLLGRPVEADTDFFRAGGDSLIATRMIAQLHQLGMGEASLQAIFAHPQLAAFCAALEAAVIDGDRPCQDPACAGTVPLARGTRPAEVFAIHASDGGVAAYLPLARAMDCAVHGLPADGALAVATLGALARRHADTLRRVRPHGPYCLLGWSYGCFLAAEAARCLFESGEPVRLVLLDPVCRADFACADRGALIRLLCEGGPATLAPPDGFDGWDPSAQTGWFLARQPATGGMDAAQLEQVAHLLDLLARAPLPAPLPIPCLRIDAAQRPPHWRPADDDWRAWSAGAHPQVEQATLNAGHWALLAGDAAGAVADRWWAWHAASHGDAGGRP
ncbi:type I polyketide synthase [Cupriavidus pauculus]|nr:type I polyketide synthase [Cupriavidus pauculus]